MPKQKAVPATDSTALTEAQKLAASTNNPALFTDSFQLGDKTYKVVHLPYRDYIAFMKLVEPLLSAMTNGLVERFSPVRVPGIELPTEKLSLRAIIDFCADSLPAMVCMVCKQTQPEITVEDVEKVAQSPYQLAEIVMQQMVVNGMLKDFANFTKRAAMMLNQSMKQ